MSKNLKLQGVKKAVFPVAGLGTRMLPLTQALPKEMLPVGNKPVIQHGVDEARRAGIESFIFISHEDKPILEQHFKPIPRLEQALHAQGKQTQLAHLHAQQIHADHMTFIHQTEMRGLGHAVWCARHAVGNEPFLLILVDDLTWETPSPSAQLIAAHQKYPQAHLLSTETVPEDRVQAYGIIQPKAKQPKDLPPIIAIDNLVEKPTPNTAPSRQAVVGRYLLQPSIFDRLETLIHATPATQEVQLTDALTQACIAQDCFAVPMEATRYDCGQWHGWLAAHDAYCQAHHLGIPTTQKDPID